MIQLKYSTTLKYLIKMLVIIYYVHAVLARFKTKIYSKIFRFLATTTEKRVT